ncbi:uncharacterized protein LOC134821307 isoform X2 [Bolinopsis microptera]|uniref:uncharacterized protein LOC134821307 isoform X2 n=1 Tax=Bolinopsis microptera TaxID=2820187 RepID=UPI00307A0D77
MVLLLVLNLFFGCALSEVKVFKNYTLTFESEDCTKGQTLLAYEVSPDESHPICNDLNSDQVATLCGKVDKCAGKLGIVTNLTYPSSYPPYITDDAFTFYSDPYCGISIICFDPATHCFLPELKNGRYRDSDLAEFNEDLLASGDRLKIDCKKGFTWHWADFVTCLKMSSGESRLSIEPLCVPLSEDNLMTLLVNVTNVAHLSALTGIPESLFNPSDVRSVLAYSILLGPYCRGGDLCSVPVHKLEATTNSQNEPDGTDHVAALSGEYTMCFETSIISLFLMGLQQAGRADEYDDFNVRPMAKRASGVQKREIVDNNIEVRINNLDLVYNTTERKVIGFNVTFYLFQYNKVVHPGVVTKVMGNVSQSKYDVVLESYCRLKYCGSSNYEDCQKIPMMRFYSFPKPTIPCTFQGIQLGYAEPVPVTCDPNHYNNETNVTLCLYGDQYSPPVLPLCAKCGGKMFSNIIHAPSRVNGLNSRGANCIWEIKTSQNNTGQFYQQSKGDSKSCRNPVSYLKIREYGSDGNELTDKSNRDICLGVQMKLGPHFEVEYNSDAQSELERSFIFEFEADIPLQPWYKRYMAILIAAPLIVLFFVALVFIGVYCDHKNRKERGTSSPVIQMEYGDQISNGTWKANDSFKKNSVIEDEAISPQPRIHNAVTKPDPQRRRKKKRRGTPSKTDSDTQQAQNPAGADSLSPPTYDSWVQISNHSNPGQTTTPETGDMSPERDTEGASQVFHSPVKPKKVRTSVNSTAPLLSNTTTATSDNLRTASDQTEASAVKPRKKKRRKKRTESMQRPLPTLNGGETYQEGSVVQATPQTKRSLPPLENNAANGRALPPIIVNKNVDDDAGYPYVSDE